MTRRLKGFGAATGILPRISVLLALVLALSFAQAQTSVLPKEVQADLIMRQIIADVGEGRTASALAAIDAYRELDVGLPPALLFLEARAAEVEGDAVRATTALEAYFNAAGRDDERYSEALERYARLQPLAERQALEQRLEEAADAIAEGRYADALENAEAFLAATQTGDPLRVTALRLQDAAEAGRAGAARALLASLEMVDIPAGRFQMGNRRGHRDGRERPVRRVQVPAFRLGKYPVTFEQYDRYCQAARVSCPDDSGFGRGDRPVINVTWDEAQAFVRWLNEHGGNGFRLPTEAEWEYAARAGTTTEYPWGDRMEPRRANCRESDCQDGFPNTSPVGSFPANAFGLYDMHGNVWEWVQDCWNSNYRGAPTDGSAWLSGSCGSRVRRGGSWYYEAGWLRSSSRSRTNAGTRRNNNGFRLAQDP